MKGRRIRQMCVSAAIAASLLTASVTPSFAETLYYGVKSTAVSTLQQNLITLGYLQISAPTGYYGTLTTSAIQAFQKNYGLSVTGTADDATQAEINHAVVKRQIVNDSKSYIGVPYVWGGTTPAGFDCSGFVYYMLTTHGVPMVRLSSSHLYQEGTPISVSKLMPGDLVFFSFEMNGVVDHVGIYMGNGQFISATKTLGVWIYSLDTSYWGSRFVGAKRIY